MVEHFIWSNYDKNIRLLDIDPTRIHSLKKANEHLMKPLIDYAHSLIQ